MFIKFCPVEINLQSCMWYIQHRLDQPCLINFDIMAVKSFYLVDAEDSGPKPTEILDTFNMLWMCHFLKTRLSYHNWYINAVSLATLMPDHSFNFPVIFEPLQFKPTTVFLTSNHKWCSWKRLGLKIYFWNLNFNHIGWK